MANRVASGRDGVRCRKRAFQRKGKETFQVAEKAVEWSTAPWCIRSAAFQSTIICRKKLEVARNKFQR
jgi:hypothetical protein